MHWPAQLLGLRLAAFEMLVCRSSFPASELGLHEGTKHQHMCMTFVHLLIYCSVFVDCKMLGMLRKPAIVWCWLCGPLSAAMMPDAWSIPEIMRCTGPVWLEVTLCALKPSDCKFIKINATCNTNHTGHYEDAWILFHTETVKILLSVSDMNTGHFWSHSRDGKRNCNYVLIHYPRPRPSLFVSTWTGPAAQLTNNIIFVMFCCSHIWILNLVLGNSGLFKQLGSVIASRDKAKLVSLQGWTVESFTQTISASTILSFSESYRSSGECAADCQSPQLCYVGLTYWRRWRNCLKHRVSSEFTSHIRRLDPGLICVWTSCWFPALLLSFHGLSPFLPSITVFSKFSISQ